MNNIQKTISVIVPVYNEVASLEKSLNKIDLFLSTHLFDYEIIIVESGSTDGSGDLCDSIVKKNKNYIVIHEGRRNGFGSAIKRGFFLAKKELVWVVTLDLPFDLQFLVKAMPFLEQYDYIISNRVGDPRNILRKVQSYFYNSFVKKILGLHVQTINSAFKVYKRKMIQNISLRSNGWFIDAEILYRLKKKNLTYYEMSVPLLDRMEGKSKIKPWTALELIKELGFFVLHEIKNPQ